MEMVSLSFADLRPELVQQIRNLEVQICKETQQQIVLLAYEDHESSKRN